MNRLTRSTLFVVMIWCLAGCSKAPTGPTTAKVSGTVNLDGKPMSGGEIQFSAPGQPPKSMEIKDGAFSGEAFAGKNRVEVILMKDGPPSSTDPKVFTKVSVISDQYWGGTSTLSADVDANGTTGLKFDVTSKR